MPYSDPPPVVSQERLTDYINALSTFTALLTPEGKVEEVNKAATQATGLPLDNFIGQSFDSCYWWNYDGAIQATLRDDILQCAAGQQVDHEASIQVAGGQLITIRFLLTPVKDSAGVISYLVAEGQDITQQKEAAERLTDYINALSTFTALLTPEGKVEQVNKAATQATGLSLDNFIGQSFENCYWWNYNSKIQQQLKSDIERCLCGHKIDREVLIQVAGGNLITVRFLLTPVKNAQGEINYLVAEGQDITERKKLENQRRQSSKLEALGTLAGGIAHEFNNILGVMLGNTELSMAEFSEGSPERRQLEVVMKSGERATNLVRQIMTFSRMDTTSFNAVNLSEVIQDILKITRASIPANIEILQDLPKLMPNIKADVTQIHQIILNLCSNAYHSMEVAGGTLKIKLDYISNCDVLEGVSECVKLTVEDSGKGMAEEVRDQIFDPFFTTKEVGKGTGLGLAVVHGIIEKHNGKITIESELNKGTVFSMYFPVAEQPPQQESLNDHYSSNALTEKDVKLNNEKMILVVEDELTLVDVYRDFLQQQGYSVSVCNNGEDALNVFRNSPAKFDLVLTDHAMPKMTGKQLIPKLLEIRSDLPIILSTGYNDVVTEKEALQLGLKEYLLKPVRLVKLKAVIEKYLTANNR